MIGRQRRLERNHIFRPAEIDGRLRLLLPRGRRRGLGRLGENAGAGKQAHAHEKGEAGQNKEAAYRHEPSEKLGEMSRVNLAALRRPAKQIAGGRSRRR